MCSRILEILVRPQTKNSTVQISELPPGKENTFYFKSRVCYQFTGKFPLFPCPLRDLAVGKTLPILVRGLAQTCL